MEPEEHHQRFKAKIAVFFGYNGEKFQGMQYQREHTNTIENLLHAVLVSEGFILETNAVQLRKIKWSRAARTDKKVHALCNGISMKLEINPKYVIDEQSKQFDYKRIMFDLNEKLPQDIKILVLRRVGKSFDMRHDAKTRVYNYILPSNLFQPFEKFKEGVTPIQGQDLEKVIEKLNELVKFYLGTHNFYNFTRGYKQTDPRCDRYMIKMSAEKVEPSTVQKILTQCQKDPEKYYHSFIRFTLVGQSFIYHQIRKMIGLLIKIFSEELDGQQTIKTAFKSEQYDVYLAPGAGLYLNRMTFQSYNNRSYVKQKLEFTEQEQNRINEYRAYLQTKIIKHEIEEKIFTDWLVNRSADYEDKVEEKEEPQQSQNNEEDGQKSEGQGQGDQKKENNGKDKNKSKWKKNRKKK